MSLWLLLQVFSNGCTAMTGVEAVSNGVRAFREPTVRNAQRTLTVIIGLLAILLAGIAYLVRAYGIQATDPGKPGYQSVLSMLVAAVSGRGWFYYFTIGSVLVILSLSANTAFADFPRLCKAVAHDGFLPHSFGYRGRRLVYSQGIFVLAVLAAILLIVFRGVTDRLIPLFAIGAFLAFTLSQAGMVGHWRRTRGRGRGSQHDRQRPGRGRHGHHAGGRAGCEIYLGRVGQRAADRRDDGHDAVGAAALRQGGQGNADFHAAANRKSRAAHRDRAHPVVDDDFAARDAIRADAFAGNSRGARRDGRGDDELQENWNRLIAEAGAAGGRRAADAGDAGVPLPAGHQAHSRLRAGNGGRNPGRQIAVIVPELVERHWYHYPLHNQRAELLKAFLLLKGSRNIVLINVPWYISA